jgi:F-type H+-transporting ATPase subunit delta
MIPGSLARRYARALIGLAPTPAARDKYAKDLAALAAIATSALETGGTVLSVLSTRRYTLADRKKLLDALGRRVMADAMVVKFLAHAIEQDRIDGIVEISRAYTKMADEAAGRLQAEVTSAAPLAPDAQARLQQALAKATGKTIVLTTKVDPELLGGVVTKLGSYVLDGSLRSALARMRTGLST